MSADRDGLGTGGEKGWCEGMERMRRVEMTVNMGWQGMGTETGIRMGRQGNGVGIGLGDGWL